jgi:hypothetical protein
VDRGAARARRDPGLPQDRHRVARAEGGFERAQLRVDLPDGAELGEHQGIVALAEAVEVEDEAAEVPVCQLARLAQEARAPSQPAAGTEARGPGGGACRLGVCGLTAVGRLRRGGSGSRARYVIHDPLMLSARLHGPLQRSPPRARDALGHLGR